MPLGATKPKSSKVVEACSGFGRYDAGPWQLFVPIHPSRRCTGPVGKQQYGSRLKSFGLWRSAIISARHPNCDFDDVMRVSGTGC